MVSPRSGSHTSQKKEKKEAIEQWYSSVPFVPPPFLAQTQTKWKACPLSSCGRRVVVSVVWTLIHRPVLRATFQDVKINRKTKKKVSKAASPTRWAENRISEYWIRENNLHCVRNSIFFLGKKLFGETTPLSNCLSGETICSARFLWTRP